MVIYPQGGVFLKIFTLPKCWHSNVLALAQCVIGDMMTIFKGFSLSLFLWWVGQRGGCIIVDSTRKGKRFPDSMSKTIPIWTCVLNRAVFNYLHRVRGDGVLMEGVSDDVYCSPDMAL